jgi:DNA-binding protein HU-beta
LTKQELIDVVSEKAGHTKKDTAAVVDVILETIVDSLKRGEKVAIVGFGTFEAKTRKAREGRNPATVDTSHIAALIVPSFKAGRALKDALA